jgi:hypothetical protein
MEETSLPAGLSDVAEWSFALAALVLLGWHLLLGRGDRLKEVRLFMRLRSAAGSTVRYWPFEC